MATKPDTITIHVTNETELEAGSADLTVVVEGSSVFSGNEAFAKAAELRALVDALAAAGVDKDSIKLRSVSLKSGNWSAIRSSGARYVIAIKGVGVDRLATVLGVVAAQKSADLTYLAWDYPGEIEARRRLRQEAIGEALAQARLDSQALGVEILGVYQLEVQEPGVDTWRAPPVGSAGMEMDMMLGRARGAGPPDIGFELGASKTCWIGLRVEFRVGPMG